MEKLRFAVIGSGWRSLFYWRIAHAYPERFEMTSLLCRSREKAERMNREYGVPAVFEEGQCEAAKPDFVVVAVDKNSLFSVSRHWLEKGYPVLCETPAAMNREDLRELWRLCRQNGAKIQVAEQYFLYPSFAAALELVKRGYLGDPYALDISAVHDYHGASLIRRFLGVGFENTTLSGAVYRFPVEETDSRYGAVMDGKITQRERVRFSFDFEKGKVAFYDFDGIQYHSFIRSRHLRVQGQSGELDDKILRYVDANHVPHREQIEEDRVRQGGICRIRLGNEVLYENPFYRLGESLLLPQDETAIGTLLLGMGRFIREGVEIYPLAEGLQDAYIRILMEEALKKRVPVRSQRQDWSQDRELNL